MASCKPAMRQGGRKSSCPRTVQTCVARAQAGHEVRHRHQHQASAQPLQAIVADLPAGRQLPAGCSRNSKPRQQHVAQPVGQHAHRQDARDLAVVQPQPRVEPVAEGDAAHQRAQVQVEGVADEVDRHHLARGQFVPGVAPPDQVEAAVQQVAGQREADRRQQGRARQVAQRVEHVVPVDVARIAHQQASTATKKSQRQQPRLAQGHQGAATARWSRSRGHGMRCGKVRESMAHSLPWRASRPQPVGERRQQARHVPRQPARPSDG